MSIAYEQNLLAEQGVSLAKGLIIEEMQAGSSERTRTDVELVVALSLPYELLQAAIEELVDEGILVHEDTASEGRIYHLANS